jgi:transcriptional regulator with XRE-family HTH domain
MSQRIIILGKRFADLRRERYLTQDEFAQKLDMSAANVRRLEQSESSGMQFRNFRKLATLVNVSPQELRRRICVPTTAQEPQAARGPGGLQDEQFPRGIRPDTLKEVTEVEHFHGVSAARTEQRTATGRGKSPVPGAAQRRFAVTVDGDCMEPKYRDGDSVIFSVDAAESEGIVEGRNYFIQFADGENTFKRIFLDPENHELLVLKCWNEKYPPRVVERSSIKLLARAVFKLTPDEKV